VRLVPGAVTAAAGFFLVSRRRGIQAAQVRQELGGQLAASRRGRAGRRDLLPDAGSVSCSDLFADAARAQAAAPRGAGRRPDRGPAPGRGAAWARPSVPPRDPRPPPRARPWNPAPPPPPTARRPGRLCSCHRPAAAAPAKPARAARPAPAPPGGGPLPGQQPAQPAGAPGSPRPLRPRRRPPDQRAGLGRARTDPQITQRLFRRADRHHRVRALVRIDPDHHRPHQHTPPSSPEMARPWRASLIPGLLTLAPLSSHATARTDRPAPRSKARPRERGRQAVREPAHRTSERYGQAPQRRPRSLLGRFGVSRCPAGHVSLRGRASGSRSVGRLVKLSF
jgi:hypothetical protein